VSSPSEGDVIRFVSRVPAGNNENNVLVCSNRADFELRDCEVYSIPTTGGGPIRVWITHIHHRKCVEDEMIMW
jgi:hypothetical protein